MKRLDITTSRVVIHYCLSSQISKRK